MENLILKQGCFVKVIALGHDLRTIGLSTGSICLVERLSDGTLGVLTPSGHAVLVNNDGTLTDACLDVTLYRQRDVPTLARGIGQG